MPKVTRRGSEIHHPLRPVEEEVVVRSGILVTPPDNKVSMTRDMLRDIIAKAVEDQKRLAEATSADL